MHCCLRTYPYRHLFMFTREEDDRDLLKGKSRQAKCDDDDDEMSPGSPGSGKTSDNAAIKYNDQNGVCNDCILGVLCFLLYQFCFHMCDSVYNCKC